MKPSANCYVTPRALWEPGRGGPGSTYSMPSPWLATMSHTSVLASEAIPTPTPDREVAHCSTRMNIHSNPQSHGKAKELGDLPIPRNASCGRVDVTVAP